MNFKQTDRVKIIGDHSKAGELGRVSHVYEDAVYLVVLDSGNQQGFFQSELELFDDKREALIELAETLDKARLQANAIDDLTIQSQRGVYGQIVLALTDTLERYFEDKVDDTNLFANLAYNSILDGNTVREALAAVK